jgi:DNA-binding PadR family transcriptional regulator
MTVGIRHFILGLLANQPMSGYDVKRLFGRFRWLIGRSSFGNIYPALHTLLDEGLVTMRVVSSPDRPPRKVYHINEQGLAALEEWNREPVGSGASLKTFVMRLLMSGNLDREALIAYLDERRAEVVEQQGALQELADRGHDGDLGRRLALEYGLALSGREIDWLEQTLEQLGTRAPYTRQS